MVNTVVVDGGGSRCRLAVIDTDGSVLSRVEVDQHASLTAGVEAAWAHIQQGLQTIRAQSGYPDSWWPEKLMLGLAGSLRQSQRQAFLQLIPSQVRAELVTDGIAQLYGVTLGEPGVCLAVGTGSVVHWLDTEGVEGMAGGWGYPVGDQGSGAWLGMRALERYLAYRDGMVGSSALVDSIGKKIGEDVSAIQSWSTQSQASVMAALAPLVFESVARGDAAGKAMLAKAVEACIELIRCAPENLPVFVVGGIGQQLQPDLQTLLGSRLQQPRADALHGLWLLSQR